MRNIIFTKGVLLGIIMLFVGTSIIPSELGTSAIDITSTDSIKIIINDDGSGDPIDKRIDVPAYIPNSGITPTIMINFTITGLNSTEPTTFYGDNPWEDWKNISLTGDILSPVNGATLYHVGTKGDWNCYITPTKPSGVLALRIDWPGNGSANNSIQIVNGTFVTPQVDSFLWGYDYNLTVTVLDMDGASVKNAEVYLIWEEDNTEFNHTSGTNELGNGLNGEYTFWITKEDQGVNVPKNITFAVQSYGEFWGYANVAMKQPNETLFILSFGLIVIDAIIDQAERDNYSYFFSCLTIEKVTVVGFGSYFYDNDSDSNTHFYLNTFTNVSVLVGNSFRKLEASEEYQHFSLFVTPFNICGFALV